MATKTPEPKSPEEPKKKVKKLTIIDANEPAPAEELPTAPEIDEQAAIDEAFADVPAEPEAPFEPDTPAAPEPPEVKAPVSKKITVSHDEDVLVEEPVETPAEVSAEEPADEPEEKPADPDLEEMLAPDAPVEPKAEAEAEPEPEAEEEPDAETEAEPEASTAPEIAEEPVVEKKKPLSQLTNNVPLPPRPVADVIKDIEPEKEFSDVTTANAVDDIVAKESDELLAQEDAVMAEVAKPAKTRQGFKSLVKRWWGNPAARWGLIAGFVLLLGLIAGMPTSRYAILNAAGVRVSASLTVLSSDSQQPLKTAQVTMGGQTVTTDNNGRASFTKLRLGKTSLDITKRGFAPLTQSKVLGWGSNPLGSLSMTVTGTRLIFNVKDFLSGEAVGGAEATSGDYNALADDNGKIILAVDPNANQDLDVTIKADGYRDEKVTMKSTGTTERTIQMAPARPRVFVSKRSGKLDIYKVDADGKNESILLAATGKEREDMAVLQQPDGDYTAIVSTRLGTHNKDGYLLSNLFILNNKTGELTKLNESERIQLADWTGDRIVFVAVTEGASAANPSRSKLFSFQIGQPGAKQIASANYFNDVAIFKGAIYYAPSSYAVQVSSVKFYKVNPDGSNQATLLSNEVWNIFRSDYDTLQLSVQQDWYEYKSGSTPTKLSVAPANPKSRTYRDSADGRNSLWVDSRDGKGVLVDYSVADKKEETLQSQAGLGLPVFWLNNSTVVYRISDGHETADYVKSINGGDAKKLRDVTATDSSNYFN